MPTRAELFAQHVSRVTAAVAFWIVTVLFVANVSLLSGWLAGSAAAEPSPEPVPPPPASDAPSDAAAVGQAPTVQLTPFAPLEHTDTAQTELDGGAVVTFPGPADRTDEFVEVDGEDVVVSLHSFVDDDEATYSVAVIEYPGSVDLSDPAVNLLQSVSGAAGNAGGRVTSQDGVVVDGAPGIEFTVETASVRVVARNVLAGRRLYSQTVAHAAGDAPEDAAAFFDSFALVDQ